MVQKTIANKIAGVAKGFTMKVPAFALVAA
jgi:hypothetical protein